MPGYMAYLLTILSMVYIVDEIASNIYNSLQSDMILEFYVNGMGLEFNAGLATYSAMTAPLYVCMLITPFYKSLADRFGRKIFLALNTFGMGAGMFVCMLAPNPVIYLVGIGIIYFLMNNDMQVLYIMLPGESTPTNLRVSVVGTMGIMSGVGSVLSIAIMTVGMLFVEPIGLLCLCVCVPFLLIATIILITKVNETKGMDLSAVTGSEWD